MNLDTTNLAGLLSDQRWFGDKGRAITEVTHIDHGAVEDRDDPLVLALVRVHFADGGSALYHLPLIVSSDGTPKDASEEPERLKAFGHLLAHGHPIKGEHGVFHFSGPSLDPMSPPGQHSAWMIGTEQSNTSVVLDDHVILKFFRRVEAGPNPDLELTRLLTNEGFNNIPAQLGEIFYERNKESEEEVPFEVDLGIAQTFVQGATEGWAATVQRIHRMFDEVHPEDTPEDRPMLVEERASELLDAIEQLGEATGDLHVTLAREDFEPEVRPEPLESHEIAELARDMLACVSTLEGDVPELSQMSDQIAAHIQAIDSITDFGQKTRVHGDYHLGQVLRSSRQWLLLDFEGEPARTLVERRQKQSPLKDVAGMLRSFNYAAYAALFERCEPDDEEWKRLEPWAGTWEALARTRFITAYLTKSYEGHFLPQDRDSLALLLDLFELDKALYEVRYERGHRPHWLRIPLRGIAEIIERGDGR